MTSSRGLLIITKIANKATRILNFIKLHISKCSTDTKATAYYLLMVWPVMEYAFVAIPHMMMVLE